MTEASFIGDEWHCRCGNQSHTDGFYPCLRNGQFVEPTEEKWTDGDLHRCERCGAIIETDSDTEEGSIVGETQPAFVAQTSLEAA